MCDIANAEQAEVVQQGQEVFAAVESVEGEAELEGGIDLLLADDAAEQVEVAVELSVDRQQVAQLAVVDADIGVDQLVGHGSVGHGLIEEIEDHVGVVEVALGVLGEPIAVVPLAHHCQRGFDILIEHAAVAVHLQQAPHLLLGEAQHVVELWV